MILVSVGSSGFAFDRLLHAVGELATGEELVVQHGPSIVRPERARCVDYLPFEELAALVRDARVVVTHAGVGSILVAFTGGKTPVVVPRLKSFGETVDDHQLECARRFGRDGLVTLVEDLDELGAAVAASGDGNGAGTQAGEVPLVRELRAYIQHAMARQGSP